MCDLYNITQYFLQLPKVDSSSNIIKMLKQTT